MAQTPKQEYLTYAFTRMGLSTAAQIHRDAHPEGEQTQLIKIDDVAALATVFLSIIPAAVDTAFLWLELPIDAINFTARRLKSRPQRTNVKN